MPSERLVMRPRNRTTGSGGPVSRSGSMSTGVKSGTAWVVAAGVPLFGICRGFQEMNVAFGGTLHPEIRDLPGRENHRMPPGEEDPEVIYRLRHRLRLAPRGKFAAMLDGVEARVNSLHGQGILEEGPRIVVEGWAEDDTPEALHVTDAPGFAIGVQWHAEYDAATDPVNRRLFEAFGAAL